MVIIRAPSFMVRRICVFIFLGVMGYSIFQMTRNHSYYDMSDRTIMLKQIELEIIKSSNNQEPIKK